MLNKSIEIKKSIDELTWWRDFKEKQQQEHNQIQRDIFRETMKESRKKYWRIELRENLKPFGIYIKLVGILIRNSTKSQWKMTTMIQYFKKRKIVCLRNKFQRRIDYINLFVLSKSVMGREFTFLIVIKFLSSLRSILVRYLSKLPWFAITERKIRIRYIEIIWFIELITILHLSS